MDKAWQDIVSAGYTKGAIGILIDWVRFFPGDTLVNSRKPDIAILIDDFQEQCRKLVEIVNSKIVYPGYGNRFLLEKLAYELRDY